MYRFTAIFFLMISLTLGLSSQARASETEFKPGIYIPQYGQTTLVDTDFKIPTGTEFKVLFDVVDPADPGKINRNFNSGARFLNMHVNAGISPKKLQLAIVVHGKAAFDLTKTSRYEKQNPGQSNANAELIKLLTDKGVRIILCGQSAAYYDISNANLLPGVEMALSAMTAHAVLQQDGYTLNPF